ncbi:DNA polymerase III subunit beta [bacterium]|nr:DNA polymerase III subunit beta [bacterium]MBU1651969.1 DNA polymerase III subunit beta [bacterium]
MKFKVAQEPFLQGVAKVSGVVPSRTPLTFLYNIHAELKGNTLTLTASDGDVFLITSIEVEGQKDGSVLVPARPLQDLLKELPGAEIELEISPEQHLLLSTAKGQFTIPGEDSSRYPSAPQEKPDNKIQFSADDLKKILDQTTFAVSHDELRPALTGLLLQFTEDELRSVATDGHRLVKLVKNKPADGGEAIEVIVPLRTLNLLQRNLEYSKSVEVFLATNRVVFTTEDLTITSKVVEGKFPAYDAVIPKENPNLLSFDIVPFMAAVRRVSIFANQINRLVVISLSPEEIKVSAEDPDSGRKGQESVEGIYDGDPIDIGYNAQYLLEALRHMPGGKAQIKLGSATSAGVMTPEKQDQGTDLLMLLMPIRLQ